MPSACSPTARPTCWWSSGAPTARSPTTAGASSCVRSRSGARTRPPGCYDDPADEQKLWRVRESGLGVTAMIPGKPTTGPGWEDSAVPPERLGEYLRKLRALWDRYGYAADMYGHFGQGVLHCRLDFELVTAGGLESFRRYLSEAAELVVGDGRLAVGRARGRPGPWRAPADHVR